MKLLIETRGQQLPSGDGSGALQSGFIDLLPQSQFKYLLSTQSTPFKNPNQEFIVMGPMFEIDSVYQNFYTNNKNIFKESVDTLVQQLTQKNQESPEQFNKSVASYFIQLKNGQQICLILKFIFNQGRLVLDQPYFISPKDMEKEARGFAASYIQSIYIFESHGAEVQPYFKLSYLTVENERGVSFIEAIEKIYGITFSSSAWQSLYTSNIIDLNGFAGVDGDLEPSLVNFQYLYNFTYISELWRQKCLGGKYIPHVCAASNIFQNDSEVISFINYDNSLSYPMRDIEELINFLAKAGFNQPTHKILILKTTQQALDLVSLTLTFSITPYELKAYSLHSFTCQQSNADDLINSLSNYYHLSAIQNPTKTSSVLSQSDIQQVGLEIAEVGLKLIDNSWHENSEPLTVSSIVKIRTDHKNMILQHNPHYEDNQLYAAVYNPTDLAPFLNQLYASLSSELQTKLIDASMQVLTKTSLDKKLEAEKALEDLLLSLKVELLKINVSVKSTFYDYLFREKPLPQIIPERESYLLNSIKDFVELNQAEQTLQKKSKFKSFNSEITLDLYNKYKNRFEDDFFFEDGVFLIKPYTSETPREDFLITVLSHYHLNFNQNDLEDEVDDLAQRYSKLTDEEVINQLNLKYNVTLKDGTKSQLSSTNEAEVLMWPLFQQYDFKEGGTFVKKSLYTSLIRFERLYPDAVQASNYIFSKILELGAVDSIIELIFSNFTSTDGMNQVTNTFIDLLSQSTDLTKLWNNFIKQATLVTKIDELKEFILINKYVSYQDSLDYSHKSIASFNLQQKLIKTIQNYFHGFIKKKQIQSIDITNQNQLLNQLMESEGKQLTQQVDKLNQQLEESKQAQLDIKQRLETQKDLTEEVIKELMKQDQAFSDKFDALEAEIQLKKWQQFLILLPNKLASTSYEYDPTLLNNINSLAVIYQTLENTNGNVIQKVLEGWSDKDKLTVKGFCTSPKVKVDVQADQVVKIRTLWQKSFQAPTITKEGTQITVKGISFKTSTILSGVQSQFPDTSQYEQINIIAASTIKIDQDIVLKGKNIAIAADEVDVEGKVKIDTSNIDKEGTPTQEFPILEKNKLIDGVNGLNGAAGLSAGGILIAASSKVSNFDNLQLFANGGKAQDGSEGQNGLDGYFGKSARDHYQEFDSSSQWSSWSNGSLHSNWIYEFSRELGERGSRGGNGGAPGLGGEGGQPGIIQVIEKEADVLKKVKAIDNTKGKTGADGKPGIGGKAGADGKNGWANVKTIVNDGRKDRQEFHYQGKVEYESISPNYYCPDVNDWGDYIKVTVLCDKYQSMVDGLLTYEDGLKGEQNQLSRAQSATTQMINKAAIQQQQQTLKANQSAAVSEINQQEVQALAEEQKQMLDELIKQQDQEISSISEQNKLEQMSKEQANQEAQIQKDKQSIQNQLEANQQKIKENQELESQLKAENNKLEQMLSSLDEKVMQQQNIQEQIQEQVITTATYEEAAKTQGFNEYFKWVTSHARSEEIKLPQAFNLYDVNVETLNKYLNLQVKLETQQFEDFLEYLLSLEKLTANATREQKQQISTLLNNLPQSGIVVTQQQLSQIINVLYKQKPIPENKSTEAYQLMQELLKEKNYTVKDLKAHHYELSDSIYEVLIATSKYLPRSQALDLLQNSILLTKQGKPENGLSLLFHESQKIIDKISFPSYSMKSDCLVNIIELIQSRIRNLKGKNNLNVSTYDDLQGKTNFQLSQCSLYNHYFNQVFKLEKYPMDFELMKFNDIHTLDQLIKVADSFINILNLATQTSYCLPQIQKENALIFLSTFHQNIQRMILTLPQLNTLQEQFSTVKHLTDERSDLFYNIKGITVQILITLKGIKPLCVKSHAKFNKFLESVTSNRINQEIYESLLSLFASIEMTHLTGQQKVAFYQKTESISTLINQNEIQTAKAQITTTESEILNASKQNVLQINQKQRWVRVIQDLIATLRRYGYVKQLNDQKDPEFPKQLEYKEKLHTLESNQFKNATIELFKTITIKASVKIEEILEIFYGYFNKDIIKNKINVESQLRDLMFNIFDTFLKGTLGKFTDILDVLDVLLIWIRIYPQLVNDPKNSYIMDQPFVVTKSELNLDVILFLFNSSRSNLEYYEQLMIKNTSIDRTQGCGKSLQLILQLCINTHFVSLFQGAINSQISQTSMSDQVKQARQLIVQKHLKNVFYFYLQAQSLELKKGVEMLYFYSISEFILLNCYGPYNTLFYLVLWIGLQINDDEFKAAIQTPNLDEINSKFEDKLRYEEPFKKGALFILENDNQNAIDVTNLFNCLSLSMYQKQVIAGPYSKKCAEAVISKYLKTTFNPLEELISQNLTKLQTKSQQYYELEQITEIVHKKNSQLNKEATWYLSLLKSNITVTWFQKQLTEDLQQANTLLLSAATTEGIASQLEAFIGILRTRLDKNIFFQYMVFPQQNEMFKQLKTKYTEVVQNRTIANIQNLIVLMQSGPLDETDYTRENFFDEMEKSCSVYIQMNLNKLTDFSLHEILKAISPSIQNNTIKYDYVSFLIEQQNKVIIKNLQNESTSYKEQMMRIKKLQDDIISKVGEISQKQPQFKDQSARIGCINTNFLAFQVAAQRMNKNYNKYFAQSKESYGLLQQKLQNRYNEIVNQSSKQGVDIGQLLANIDVDIYNDGKEFMHINNSNEALIRLKQNKSFSEKVQQYTNTFNNQQQNIDTLHNLIIMIAEEIKARPKESRKLNPQEEDLIKDINDKYLLYPVTTKETIDQAKLNQARDLINDIVIEGDLTDSDPLHQMNQILYGAISNESSYKTYLHLDEVVSIEDFELKIIQIASLAKEVMLFFSANIQSGQQIDVYIAKVRSVIYNILNEIGTRQKIIYTSIEDIEAIFKKMTYQDKFDMTKLSGLFSLESVMPIVYEQIQNQDEVPDGIKILLYDLVTEIQDQAFITSGKSQYFDYFTNSVVIMFQTLDTLLSKHKGTKVIDSEDFSTIQSEIRALFKNKLYAQYSSQNTNQDAKEDSVLAKTVASQMKTLQLSTTVELTEEEAYDKCRLLRAVIKTLKLNEAQAVKNNSLGPFLDNYLANKSAQFPQVVFACLYSCLEEPLIEGMNQFFKYFSTLCNSLNGDYQIELLATFVDEKSTYNLKLIYENQLITQDIFDSILKILIHDQFSDWPTQIAKIAHKEYALKLLSIIEPLNEFQFQIQANIDRRDTCRAMLMIAIDSQCERFGQANYEGYYSLLQNMIDKLAFQPNVTFEDLYEVLSLLHMVPDMKVDNTLVITNRPESWQTRLLHITIQNQIRVFINDKNKHLSSRDQIQIVGFDQVLYQISTNLELLRVLAYSLTEEVILIQQQQGSIQTVLDLVQVLDNLKFINQGTNMNSNVVKRLQQLSFSSLKFQLGVEVLAIELGFDLSLQIPEQTMIALRQVSTQYTKDVYSKLISIIKGLTKAYDPKDLLLFLQKVNNQRIRLTVASLETIIGEDLIKWQQIMLDQQYKASQGDYSIADINREIYLDSYNHKQNICQEWTKGEDKSKLSLMLNKIHARIKELEEQALARVESTVTREDIRKEHQQIYLIERVKEWAEQVRGKPQVLKSNLEEVIAMFSVAAMASLKFPSMKLNIQACLLFFQHAFDNEKGMMLQVPTGEGKTSLVAMWATMQVLLQGQDVDVITSSSVLVSKDISEVLPFYEVFGVSVTNNCDAEAQDQNVRIERYRKNVVYGDVSSFQRDILLSSVFFDTTSILGNRKVGCIIVDEIDSMLLDKGESSLYLSHSIPDLYLLKTLYIEIWLAIHSPGTQDDSEESVNAVHAYIAEKISDERIKIPVCLQVFVQQKLRGLIQNAYKALHMQEDDPYFVDQEHAGKKVVVMDKDTGVEQKTSQYSNGLHQFLSLKHQDKLSPESLRAVFISNLEYFQYYKGKKLFGMTGTLGSTKEKEFLNNLYDVEFINIPRSKYRDFYFIEPVIVTETDQWMLMIKDTIQSIGVQDQRPLLIICENIQAVNVLFKDIKSYHSEVFTYTSSENKPTAKITDDKIKLKGGDVLLATNIAGRGQNIKVENDTKGLHVVITYMPRNIRIEEQAFGRAARGNSNGTGQFLMIHSNANDIIEIVKQKRDILEETRIKDLIQKQVIRLLTEAELSKRFKALYGVANAELFKYVWYQTDLRFDSYRYIQLDALKNRWAFFLEGIQSQLSQVHLTGQQPIFDLFKEFETTVLKDLQSPYWFKLANGITDLIALGNMYQNLPNETGHARAMLCYDVVITREPYYCETALYYKIFSQRIYNKSINQIRAILRRMLKKCQALINIKVMDLAGLQKVCEIVDEMYQQRGKGLYQNFFLTQMEELITCYSLHKNSISQAIGCEIDLDSMKDIFSKCIDDDQARRLFRLLKKETGIFQIERISKKTKVIVDSQLPYENFTIIANTDQVWNETKYKQRPQNQVVEFDPPLKYVAVAAGAIINARINENRRNLTSRDFQDVLKTKDQFWQILQDNGLLSDIQQTYIVNYNEKQLSKIRVGEQPVSFIADNLTALKELLGPSDTKALDIKAAQAIVGPENIDLFLVVMVQFQQLTQSNSGILALNKGKVPESITQYADLIKLIQTKENEEADTLFVDKSMFMLRDTIEDAFDGLIVFLQQRQVVKAVRVDHGVMEKESDRDDRKDQITDDLKKIFKMVKKDDQYADLRDVFSGESADGICAAILANVGILKTADDMDFWYEDILKSFTLKPLPAELRELFMLKFNRVMKFKAVEWWHWNWSAFAVFMLGVAQLVAGAVLMVVSVGTAANIGLALIGEGISDMTAGVMGLIENKFNWAAWGIQKVISVALSVATLGIGAYLGASANVTTKVVGGVASVGSKMGLSTAQTFFLMFKMVAKTVIKEVGKALINHGISIGIDHLLALFTDQLSKYCVTEALATVQETSREYFDKIKEALRELFNESYEEGQAQRAATVILESCQEEIHKSFNKIYTYMEKIVGFVSGILGKKVEASKMSGTKQAILGTLLKLVGPAMQMINLSSQLIFLKSDIEDFLEKVEKQILKQAKVFENSAVGKQDTKEAEADFEKEIEEILIETQTMLVDKFTEDITASMNTVLKTGVTALTDYVVEKFATYTTDKMFKESIEMYNQLKKTDQALGELQQKQKAEGFKGDFEQSAEYKEIIQDSMHSYLKISMKYNSNMKKLGKTVLEGGVTLTDWMKKNDNTDGRLTFDKDGKISIVKQPSFESYVNSLNNPIGDINSLQQSAFATYSETDIEVVDEKTGKVIETIKSNSPVNGKEKVRVGVRKDGDGNAYYFPIGADGKPVKNFIVPTGGENKFAESVLYQMKVNENKEGLTLADRDTYFDKFYKDPTNANSYRSQVSKASSKLPGIKNQFESNLGVDGSKYDDVASTSKVTKLRGFKHKLEDSYETQKTKFITSIDKNLSKEGIIKLAKGSKDYLKKTYGMTSNQITKLIGNTLGFKDSQENKNDMDPVLNNGNTIRTQTELEALGKSKSVKLTKKVTLVLNDKLQYLADSDIFRDALIDIGKELIDQLKDRIIEDVTTDEYDNMWAY